MAQNRPEIVEYALRKLADNEMSVNEFIKQYNELLRENDVPYDNRIYIDNDTRTQVNRLSSSMYCLYKQGERLRFYDIESRDYSELLEALHLDSFRNTEISTLKLMNENPEIMLKYDIRDKYELHNLLKKISEKEGLDYITFSRQPILRFGEFDRNRAIYEIIEAFSPISLNELIEFLYSEFGYEKNTATAIFLKQFSAYYHNGVFSVDYKSIPENRSAVLNAELMEPFYYFNEIKAKYSELFQGADIDEINPRSLKKLGFSIFSGYVLRGYDSAAAYFTELLTKDDLTDIGALNKRYGAIKMFAQSYANLLAEHRLFLYDKDRTISMRRLYKFGVAEDDIFSFCNEVASFIEKDQYFTIYSLRNNGFSHKLDELGFDDIFYASILAASSEFTSQNVFGTKVLLNRKIRGQFSIDDFLLSLLREYDIVELDDFVQDCEDRFGITIKDKHRITSVTKNSELYFDPIMGKIYRNKELFYLDLDE